MGVFMSVSLEIEMEPLQQRGGPTFSLERERDPFLSLLGEVWRTWFICYIKRENSASLLSHWGSTKTLWVLLSLGFQPQYLRG